MTPAELKARIDAALEADASIRLHPAPSAPLETCCPFGALTPRLRSIDRHPGPTLVACQHGLSRDRSWAFMQGFDLGEGPEYVGSGNEEWNRLGASYRSHPRCILTQQGGAND